MMREESWTTLLMPLGLLVPAATFLNYHDERVFNRRWAAQIFGQPQRSKRPRWVSVPQPAVEELV